MLPVAVIAGWAALLHAGSSPRPVGCELGDAGGPLLVGAIAAAATLGTRFLSLAALLAVAGLAVAGAHCDAQVSVVTRHR